MNRHTMWVVAVIAVVIGLGAYWVMNGGNVPVAPGSGAVGGQQQAGVANPASVNCVNLGGRLELAQDASGGAIGICHLPDGRTCEEWSLYRGGCTNPLGGSAPATTTAQQ